MTISTSSETVQKMTALINSHSDLDELILVASGQMIGRRNRKWELFSKSSLTPAELILEIQDFAFDQRCRLDPLIPAAGGMMDGYRWHAAIPPLASDGVCFALRRHRFAELTLEKLCEDHHRNVLRELWSSNQNVVIFGPTGSGKTTVLCAILREFALDKRLLIMESIPELPILSPLWTRLTSAAARLDGLGGLTLSDAFKEALRLTPERLVLGELRGTEAPTYAEAMLTGHGGIWATIHASSEAEAARRLQELVQRDIAAPLRFISAETP